MFTATAMPACTAGMVAVCVARNVPGGIFPAQPIQANNNKGGAHADDTKNAAKKTGIIFRKPFNKQIVEYPKRNRCANKNAGQAQAYLWQPYQGVDKGEPLPGMVWFLYFFGNINTIQKRNGNTYKNKQYQEKRCLYEQGQANQNRHEQDA